MRNGRKNRNSKAWSALERKKKKKKRKNPGEVSDGHESALDAFFWDSDCSETSGVDRDRLRNEPIHPPRPRECSSNRPSTTLESGNLIIHIESMRGIKTQRFCGEEFGFLIFMDGVSFFFYGSSKKILRWKTISISADRRSWQEFEDRLIQRE